MLRLCHERSAGCQSCSSVYPAFEGTPFLCALFIHRMKVLWHRHETAGWVPDFIFPEADFLPLLATDRQTDRPAADDASAAAAGGAGRSSEGGRQADEAAAAVLGCLEEFDASQPHHFYDLVTSLLSRFARRFRHLGSFSKL
jgi:hypothetical protein